MRTLDKNKIPIWYSNITSTSEQVDSDGFKTGSIINVYGTPVQAYMVLYPASGRVMEEIFGTDVQLDMVGVSDTIVLNENSLIFIATPSTPYYDKCDYTVSKISKSLNHTNYGLKRKLK